MKKRNRFFVILCVVLALLLLLCACSRQASNEAGQAVKPDEAAVAPKTTALFAPSATVTEDTDGYFYTVLPLSGYRLEYVLPADGDLVYAAAVPCDANGRYLVDETGVIPMQILQYDLAAQKKTDFCYQPELNGAADVQLSAATLASDGSLWCLVTRFRQENDELSTLYALEHVCANGTVSDTISLNCAQLRSDPELLLAGNGNFLLYTPADGLLSTYDPSGALRDQQSIEALNQPIVRSSDKKLWMCVDTEDGVGISEVGSTDVLPLSGISNGQPVFCYGADAQDTLYAADATCIYCVSLQSGTAERLIDLSLYNVRGGRIFSRTANGSFVFVDDSSGVACLAALCPGTSGGKQKTVLTLATVNPSGQTIAQVLEFNRSNTEYQVEILDFSAELDSGSYTELFTTWSAAFAAGDRPDMIDFSNLPWHGFADRGMLLDLNTILPQEDILPWLWNAVSYHDANYTFPGCFTVETLVGKQAQFGSRQHWTVQEFLDLAETSEIPMFSGMNRELFLFYLEQYLLDSFLDEETKTCSFDSEEFQALLAYAATLPETEDPEGDVEDSLLLLRRDFALTEPVILSNVAQMHSAESYTVGQPLAWIGWPCQNGTKVRPDAEIAVFKDTDHTDGAAAFLQFLLSDTSQTLLGRFAFPMTVSAFEKEIRAATETRIRTIPNLQRSLR